jgi:hypothetical protein
MYSTKNNIINNLQKTASYGETYVPAAPRTVPAADVDETRLSACRPRPQKTEKMLEEAAVTEPEHDIARLRHRQDEKLVLLLSKKVKTESGSTVFISNFEKEKIM